MYYGYPQMPTINYLVTVHVKVEIENNISYHNQHIGCRTNGQ